MGLDPTAVTREKALSLLKAAGAKHITMETLESDLEVAGIGDGDTISLFDLAAYWVRLADGNS